MPEIPSGTVTFLFTDIEGSTKRWEQHTAAMQVALERHDALLRAAIEAHAGHVFKTVGDAFCAAFASADDALGAALASQRAVHAEDWSAFGPEFPPLRVRMGIHTGAAQERDGDYFGPAVNRAARLEAAGHGGQGLLSAVTWELVRGELPAGIGLRDLGERRLKDLRRPELLGRLAGWSLGVAGEREGEPWYSYLETVREYAGEKLTAAGEIETIRDRHLAWYIGFVSTLKHALRGPDQDPIDWRRQLELQHDNMRGALDWGLDDPERTREVVALAAPLSSMWPHAGIADMREGHRWLDRVRQAALVAHLDETDPEAVAGVMLGAGALIDHFDVELGETRFAEAHRLFSRCGASVGEADALARLGWAALNRNNLEGGESMLEQSLALMRSGGQDWDIAGVLNGLGEAARLRGDLDRAADLYEEAIARATSDGPNATTVLLGPLHNLGHVELRRGNVMAAAARFTEFLRLDMPGGQGIFVALGLAGLGGMAAALSQARRAAVSFGAADTVLSAAGFKFDFPDQMDWDRNVALARAQLDAAAWDAAWTEGAAMTLEDAVAYALETTNPRQAAGSSSKEGAPAP